MSDCSTCGSRSYCNSTSESCDAAKKENALPLAEGATVRHVVGVVGKGRCRYNLFTAVGAALQEAGYRGVA